MSSYTRDLLKVYVLRTYGHLRNGNKQKVIDHFLDLDDQLRAAKDQFVVVAVSTRVRVRGSITDSMLRTYCRGGVATGQGLVISENGEQPKLADRYVQWAFNSDARCQTEGDQYDGYDLREPELAKCGFFFDHSHPESQYIEQLVHGPHQLVNYPGGSNWDIRIGDEEVANLFRRGNQFLNVGYPTVEQRLEAFCKMSLLLGRAPADVPVMAELYAKEIAQARADFGRFIHEFHDLTNRARFLAGLRYDAYHNPTWADDLRAATEVVAKLPAEWQRIVAEGAKYGLKFK